jgi:tetratricopeptide (TPR) repeat protein
LNPEPTRDDSPTPLAGRYALGEELGRGGGGIVRKAIDLLTGETVAIKTIHLDARHPEPRTRREAAAMRLLRVPGVVALRDEVVLGDETHFVMDLVDGRPFPGPLPENVWERIAPRVRGLFEVLARVHAAGVVHRDLKPNNVLVDDRDRVTLLDFGVSWGSPLGESLTQSGTIVGTPEYLAPEQFRGHGNDPRVDLYAVGVMLYEVLGGRPPHDARDFATLYLQRTTGKVEPLDHLAPRLPQRVTAAVMSLLSVDPGDRPASARAALRLFFGTEDDDPAAAALPRLGTREVLDRAVSAALSGRSVDVFGERGTGRTRLLSDTAHAVRAAGRSVLWLCEGRSPYASLDSVIGTIGDLGAHSRDEARDTVLRRLRAVLARGDVVLADDPGRIDRWSADVLAACRADGSVVRVVATPSPDCLVTGRLVESDLPALFAGPSRLLHLPEDGAAELWRRTGGHPAAVRTEVAAWVRAGIAHWAGGRLAVTRQHVDRLRGGVPVGVEIVSSPALAPAVSPEFDEILAWLHLAWPHATTEQVARASRRPSWIVESIIGSLADDGAVRKLPNGIILPLASSDALVRWSDAARRLAHRAIADAVPRGSVQRLCHLASAGDTAAVVPEALELAESLVDDGRSGDAWVALGLGLDAAKETGDPRVVAGVLESLARTALLSGTVGDISKARYELDRSGASGPRPDALRALLAAVSTALGPAPEPAVAQIAACGPFESAALERARHVWLIRAAERVSLDRMEDAVRTFGAWAAESGDALAVAAHEEILAHAHWRRSRLDEAAAAYQRVAATDPSGRGRLAALLNLGSVLSQAERHREALDVAERARTMAAERRNPAIEAHAESLLRDVRYALGEAGEPDLELLEALTVLESPDMAAWGHLREAAVARRCGRPEQAVDLARASLSLANDSGQQGVALLAECLAAACGAPLAEGDVARLATAAAVAYFAWDGVEALALLLLRGGTDRPALRAALGSMLALVPAAERRATGMVLTCSEIERASGIA